MATRNRDKYADACAAGRAALRRAGKADLTPTDLKALNAVVCYTALYSRLSDKVFLGQLASDVWGVDRAEEWQIKKIGRSLAKLSRLGIIEYEPGRGQSRPSTVTLRRPIKGPGSESLSHTNKGVDESDKGIESSTVKGVNGESPTEKSEKSLSETSEMSSTTSPRTEKGANTHSSDLTDSLVARLCGVCMREGADVEDEARHVVAVCRRYVGDSVIDEAIGYAEGLRDQPRSPRYFLRTIQAWGLQRGVNVPDLTLNDGVKPELDSAGEARIKDRTIEPPHGEPNEPQPLTDRAPPEVAAKAMREIWATLGR